MDTLAVLTVAGSLTAAFGTGLCWARAQARLQRTTDSLDRLRHEAAEAAHAAHHDDLTALPNRRAFTAATAHHLRHPPSYSALLLLDLDGFKAINDRLGHGAGDEVLIAVAGRLHSFAAGRPVARLGGDEFVLLIAGPYPAAVDPGIWPLPLGQRLREALAQPIRTTHGTVSVTGSVGIATLTDPCTLGNALARADMALYQAKYTSVGVAVHNPQTITGHLDPHRRTRAVEAGRTHHPAPCT
ncbi:GGDEF domain-containing protein [Longispora sp. NPDC051575]|uniref:GGDEF domain-containing protein n=1 Tax=Longispora sp. NPDC051575 TaxID=3154943 RepID=UPI003434E12D